MISNEFDNYILKYIEGYLFADMSSLRNDISPDKHPGNGAYTLLLSVLSAMEFIGLLMRAESPIQLDENSRPIVDASKGLGAYIKDYLSKVDKDYKALSEIAPRLIRNGIVHTYATKGNIAITRQGSRGESHLKIYGTRKTLIINVDFLLDDFLKSYHEYAKPNFSVGGVLYEAINNNYQAIRAVYKSEVGAAIAVSQRKLDQLEQVHSDIDGPLEELEANGAYILVS